MRELSERRRKLLDLYYNGKVSMDLFEEEEQRLALGIEAARNQVSAESAEEKARTELDEHFERVAAALRDLDVDQVWEAATDQERRVLIEELLEWVTVFPDHLEVTVAGAPPLACRSTARLDSRSRRLLVSEGGLEPPRPFGH